MIPVETKVIADHTPFVRRGQSVYVIREDSDSSYLAQSTASLEIAPLPKNCVGQVLGIPKVKRSTSVGRVFIYKIL